MSRDQLSLLLLHYILYSECYVYHISLYMHTSIMYLDMCVHMYTYMHMRIFCFKHPFIHLLNIYQTTNMCQALHGIPLARKPWALPS